MHRGSLDDLASLRGGAAAADGVTHTAFIHDFSKFKINCETDRRAIETLGSALAGSDRSLVVTSGTGMLPPSQLAEEHVPASSAIPRVASEEAAALVAAHGVHVSMVRLPPSVYGDGDHAFVPLLISVARDKGVSVGLRCIGSMLRVSSGWYRRRSLSRGGRGRAVPRYRQRDRPPPGPAGRRQVTRRSGQPLWLVRATRDARQSDVERADAGPTGMAAETP